MRASSNFTNSGNVYKPGVSLATSQGLLEAFCPDSTVVSLAFSSPSQLQVFQSYQRASQSNVLMSSILISFLF